MGIDKESYSSCNKLTQLFTDRMKLVIKLIPLVIFVK